jgi:predicted HicB family RNase H-like nuclease
MDRELKPAVAMLIRISPELHRRVKAAAGRRGMTMSDFVKKCIRSELEDEALGPLVARRLREG